MSIIEYHIWKRDKTR